MAEMTSEKFVTRENAVRIIDCSGNATYLGKKDYKGQKQLPTGWAGMESYVPVFSDHKLATHARVDVTNYQGYEATQQREFLFVKNGFILARMGIRRFHPTKLGMGLLVGNFGFAVYDILG